jgi:hypothetical protein
MAIVSLTMFCHGVRSSQGMRTRCGESHSGSRTEGTSYGAPSPLEIELAKSIMEFMPNIEMIRFVNSGTEATMSALRLARAYTKREKIIKFDGCYHGHADMLLVQAGSGVATLGLPDSPGVPSAVASDTLVAQFNDLESVEALFKKYPDQIAGSSSSLWLGIWALSRRNLASWKVCANSPRIRRGADLR